MIFPEWHQGVARLSPRREWSTVGILGGRTLEWNEACDHELRDRSQNVDLLNLAVLSSWAVVVEMIHDSTGRLSWEESQDFTADPGMIR